MKKKPDRLQSPEYQLLLRSFAEWLTLLNYSPLSIPSLTRAIRDFLYYQEATGKLSLEQLVATDANGFIALLQAKGIYSNGHINKQIQALKLLAKYMRETRRVNAGFNLERLEERRGKPVWLTQAEIRQLYEAVPDSILGIRDKAMLAVYYGCGLRLNEGVNLEVNDIDVMAGVLHVRKGKHYKERFVPIAEKNLEEIKLYIDYGRPQLLQDNKSNALFIDANKGRPIQRESLYVRIKQLVKKAKITRKAGTHTLRHSIATHLLQSGMKLERIQQFLGHADLDSTQIYTHLANETEINTSKWKFKNESL
ncbi:MAG: tyrosine-type recombinase/integrase [Sediminibacterium sp.]|nr:tyrosine-type recombinase/integrase [Sediminibacterium sp.]